MRGLVGVVLTGAVAMVGVGCGATPAARFYTLGAIPGAVGAPTEVSVVVGPVTVPVGVDRPQIVVRAGANQVRLDEFNRWAGPLQNDIARVVAENLVAMLGTPRVATGVQALSGGADYRAVIEVQGFESALGEAARLEAVWTVSRGRDGMAQTGRTVVREPTTGAEYEALAAAHSRALARLSQDIADAVRALGRSTR